MPYLDDGSLGETEELALRSHLASCRRCADGYHAMTALFGRMRADWKTASPVSPEGYVDGVMKRIEHKKHVRLVMFRTFSVAAAVLAVVALSIAAYMFGFRGGDIMDHNIATVPTEEYRLYIAEHYMDAEDAKDFYENAAYVDQELLLQELADSPSLLISAEDVAELMDEEDLLEMFAYSGR